MRGVNRRRAASSDAAAASSPSDSDSEDDAAAKSGRLESDSEFSERRSGGMGGIPAGGGGGAPRPSCVCETLSIATGSSSAVKSIVVASCCSITASRGRSGVGRPAKLYGCVAFHAPSAICVARGVRPLLSRRRPPLVRPRSSSRSSAAYLVGVWQRTAQATQGTECLSRLAIEVNQVQKSSCTQPCCRLRCTRPPLRESKRQQQSARATRGLAGCNFSALQSTLKHALPWHNNATRPARSPAELQQRFTQEQHAVDAP